MKDKFNRKMNRGDLVYFGNVRGVLVDDTTYRAYSEYGTTTTLFHSNVVKLDADLVPEWELCRTKILDKLKDDELKKKVRLQKRIKKAEFKRFGVYCPDEKDPYNTEMYLGPCTIKGKRYENAWVKIRFNDWSKPELATMKPMKDHFFYVDFRTKEERFTSSYIRDCKYPLKHTHMFTVPQKHVDDVIEVVYEAMKEDLKQEAPLWKD